jgi:DNA repair exonuclease SbcCD ATPase subunit
MANGNTRLVDGDATNGEQPPPSAVLRVSNIGGIDESRVEFEPGVNVLVGRNATNRTSHLQAVMASLGSDDISMRSSADEAEVTLEIGDERYERRFVRENGSIASSGEPLLDDPELADLFAFLLRSNEARRAVVRGDDLRELIMRPVDTASIDREIERTVTRRREIDARLDELDERERELPKLQQQRNRYTEEIEAQAEKRERLKERIEAADAGLKESREEQAELEEKLSELQDRRSDLEDVRYRIETQEDSIDSLETERDELESELDSLSISVQDINELGTEIDRLQQRKEQLDSTVDKVRSVIQFNQEMLDDSGALHDLLQGTGDTSDEQPSTSQLLPAESHETVCWTCGTDVEREDISSTVGELQDAAEEIMAMRRAVKSDLEDCRQEKKSIESTQNRRHQIEKKLEQIDTEINRRRETLEDLESKRESLTSSIAELEGTIESGKEPEYETVLELHKEANEVEFEIERLRDARSDTDERIAEIESVLDEYDELEAERAELSQTLTDLRTRIERLEQTAVESFNDRMNEVLELLGYENIERIWIERTNGDGAEGSQSAPASSFDLNVIRSNDAGAVFDDSVDHLSESELEVTGLVFALSGYLTHEVYEEVPFMLLDSLEAVDSSRIADLVRYFGEYARFLVVALLEEDARALSETSNQITDVP